ncbi:MAG: hypothetical protein RSE39_07755 [Oscillospiraceae bacterium]
MIFSDDSDIKRCTKIVEEELVKNNVNVNDETLNKITLDIMNISYSKGGDYSDNIIQSFAETYVEEGFYKKFI